MIHPKIHMLDIIRPVYKYRLLQLIFMIRNGCHNSRATKWHKL